MVVTIEKNITDRRIEFMPKTYDLVESGTIYAEIDELYELLLKCRSIFPALSKDMIGMTNIFTPSFYAYHGFSAQIQLNKPISSEYIEQNRRLGKWINENAIIRLHGIMNYYKLTHEIDKSLSGWKEVDLMRRMRNAFSKTPLNYRPEDPDNIRLRDELIEHFKLIKNNFPENEIPTPIDKVIEPIFKGCREYIDASYRKHNRSQ